MAAEVVASIVDTLLEGGQKDDQNSENHTEQNSTKPKLSETHSYSTDEEPQTITDAVTRQPINFAANRNLIVHLPIVFIIIVIRA
uniref:Uncharacterized protein n=1 Tax=Panagrolaimus sp. PS1159 TaxID=55785 RepID=A0AC35FDG8_9BILA